MTISVSSSPGCPHKPQDPVPHKSQPRRFSKFLLHKKAVKKIENKMCVKITLMTRSAYTQPTPVTRDSGRQRLTDIYCPRSQSLRAFQNFRVHEIEGESKSSDATQLAEVKITDLKDLYFLHSFE